MRILVVEREGTVARWLHRTFGDELHSVDIVSNASDAARQAASTHYDLIVVDIDLGLADSSGRSVVADLRRIGGTWPVIVVGASGEDRDIVSAVNDGADDYLVKPLSEAVLIAHIRAVLRRTAPDRPDAIFLGDVTLNRGTHILSGALGQVRLTGKECALLELFLSTPERVVPRAEVLAKVWGFTFEPRTSVVEVAVSRVRRKLEQVSRRVHLHALRNVGFYAVSDHNTNASESA
jgi:DNA-binding response OmpR family regulator